MDRDGRQPGAGTLVRAGTSLAVHAAFGVIVIAAVLLSSHGEAAMNRQLRGNYPDSPFDDIAYLLDQPRHELLIWGAVSLVAGWLASIWFLRQAELLRPRSPAEGAALRGLWFGMLIATLAVTAAGFVYWVILAKLEGFFATPPLTVAELAVGLGTPLAFWLATGLAVTLTVKPSVPLGGLLPATWN